MSAPVFLEGYLYVGFNGYKKSMKVLMGISFVNIGVQLILQFLNVCDFLSDMDMVESISEKSFLLTFIEIQEKDVHMIVDRIFASFYSNSQNQKIKPGYEIKSNVC